MKGKEERWTLNEQAGGGAGSRKRGFDQLLEEEHLNTARFGEFLGEGGGEVTAGFPPPKKVFSRKKATAACSLHRRRCTHFPKRRRRVFGFRGIGIAFQWWEEQKKRKDLEPHWKVRWRRKGGGLRLTEKKAGNWGESVCM